MPRILISYRREDTAAHAGRLFDRLSDTFGRDNVFIDVDAIRPGQDFVHSIAATVITCDAVVAVIGRRWLTEQDSSGARRLDRPDDLLRVELATALGRGITVIPVLVGGAAMPEPGDLPLDLSRLGRLQALEIDDAEFHDDVRRLIEALNASVAGIPRATPTPPAIGRFAGKGGGRWWIAGAVLVLVAVAIFWGRRPPADSASSGDEAVTASSPTTVGAGASTGSGTVRSDVAAPSTGNPPSSPEAVSFEAPQLVAGPVPSVRQLSGLGTIDNPLAIEPGITYKLPLNGDETAFMAVARPVTDLLILVDMRTGEGESTNLQSALSVLDADGSTILPNAIAFNEIDYGWRRTQAVTLGRNPVRVTLKLVNGNKRNTVWLTLFDTPRIPFVPFFGSVIPRQLKLGAAETGEMDPGEDVYLVAGLKKGDYKVIVDLANVPRVNTNVQGYLSLLDPFGGNQRSLVRFNEIDFAYRKTTTLTVTRDGHGILRFQNGQRRSSYSLKVTPDTPPSQ